jgi:hypothetical protein
MTENEIYKPILKLMPLWALLLAFGSGFIQAIYPSINLIDQLDQEWIKQLVLGTGLGGIPLSIVKSIITRSKGIDLSKMTLDDVKVMLVDLTKKQKELEEKTN